MENQTTEGKAVKGGPSTADVLREAARILEMDGWAQGVNALRGSAICAGMAIDQAAVRLGGTNSPATVAFCSAIGSNDIIGWNDTPGRTAEEVTATLRRRADDLEVPEPSTIGAPFIVAARTAVPELVTEMERLRSENARLRNDLWKERQ